MTTTTSQNLVANGNAETGPAAADYSSIDAPSGWTVIGDFTAEDYSAGGSSDINPADSAAIGGGNAFFAGGPSNGSSGAYQTIDVSAYASGIDAGAFTFDASGYFGGYEGQDDSMSLTVTFYAADDTTVLHTVTIGGVDAAERGDVSEMLYSEISDAVPVGTRFLRVELDSTRTDGNYNDGYADNISVTLTGPGASGGAVVVSATHDFSSDTIPAAPGILFETASAATATFQAKEFGAGKISLTGTVTGDAHTNVLDVKTGAAHAFDASGLTFQSWTAGTDKFEITGSAGADAITGATVDDHINAAAGDDTIVLSAGGNDTASGGDGNDTIVMGATFTNQDRLDGAAGNDTLTLDGDYSAGVAIGAATIHNIETIQLAGGESYKLTTNEGNVAAGQTLTVNGADLGAGDKLTFSGVHETDGHFNLHGGAGADILTGGTQSSSFTGGGGIDSLTGGAGADTFVYGAVSDSTSTVHDNITGFDALNDKIDISALGFALAGVDAAITSGKLTSNFDSTLASAVNASKLDPHHAVLFSPTVGGYVGHTFLVIDVNGTAGYQASQDLVIEISSGAHLTSFGSANIVG